MDLSVVIPSYRSGKLVRRAVESAIAEGVSPENVVVVEDGVFDDTARVVADCPGVRLITLETNRGAPYARNVGLQNVATRYVMFLDADDYVENGLLPGLVRALEQQHSDLAIGPWRYAGEDRQPGMLRTPERLSNAEWIFSWTRLRFFPPCCVAWNVDSIRRIGAWDARLKKNQDGELMIRAFVRGLKVSTSDAGQGVYWQHASPHRVTNAKIDDLLHATDIIFRQLETWAGSRAANDFPESDRNALGRYCCVTAWHAYAHDRKDSGMRWMAKARAYGFRNKGYNSKTSLLATFLGVSLSSKARARFERSGIFYKLRYKR
ncbi:glycosyltransferase family 2 protein [Frateuria hangzhouensis]|uniref:glycosyltransferase family 2 protein n=1 Tax=Frateuria hangzhouensis TaxID=2995589 RepID=UPI002260CFFE|nr:glycosyltransferase family 2 protein [Frateuria sp. STR12]MCX7513938.1 glycosyltransferase family 2 protein [Frateuria sp. STR12]